MAYQIPPLRFGYEALEPHIAEFVLRRHHQLHHPAYIERLSVALASHPDLRGHTIEDLLRILPDQPPETRAALENLAGGHANHLMLWKTLSPLGGGTPHGALAEAITACFGSFSDFVAKFTEACLAHVGSGWAFLAVASPGSKNLEIIVLPNNETPLTFGKPAVLICDLWEHAYEGQYPAGREAYLKAFFKVVDWNVCRERLEQAS